MSAIGSLFGIKRDHSSLFNSFERNSLDDLSSEQIAKNRQDLYDLFSHKNWDGLSLDDKKSAVQALENDFAYQQGRPAKEVLVEPLADGRYGGFNSELDKIRLNENLLTHGNLFSEEGLDPMPDANMQIFDTIAHEGYHAYQDHALKYPFIHDDKAQLREWALNEGKYFENGEEYLIQPQERDAWAYGHEQTVKAFEGIQERNGAEPGWDEYEANAEISSYDLALERAQSEDPEVLDRMEKEMEEGCREKGIFYDHDPDQISEEDASLTSGESPPGEDLSSSEGILAEAPDAPGPQEEASDRGYRNLDIDSVSMDDIAPAGHVVPPGEEGDLSETEQQKNGLPESSPDEEESVSMDDIARGETLPAQGNEESTSEEDALQRDNGETLHKEGLRENEPSMDDVSGKHPQEESEESRSGEAPCAESQKDESEAGSNARDEPRQGDDISEGNEEDLSPSDRPGEDGSYEGQDRAEDATGEAPASDASGKEENRSPSDNTEPSTEEDNDVSMDDISGANERSGHSQDSSPSSSGAAEGSASGSGEDEKNDQSYGY